MQHLIQKGKNTLIIGGMQGIGWEFARLAAPDAASLILVDESEGHLNQIRKELTQQHEGELHVSAHALTAFDAAEDIYTDTMLYRHLNQGEMTVDQLINVLEFRSDQATLDQLWEEDVTASHYNFATLMEVNQLFFMDMIAAGKGEILNVLAKPGTMAPEVEDMFFHTQALLLEFSAMLNERSPYDHVGVHTLCTSESSFVLQAKVMPENMASDLTPPTCSAKDIADYGYQVLSRDQH
ncbi:MAG: SDR family NAD(P)-dependent oxidoreductase [Bacteroidota bacterium]